MFSGVYASDVDFVMCYKLNETQYLELICPSGCTYCNEDFLDIGLIKCYECLDGREPSQGSFRCENEASIYPLR